MLPQSILDDLYHDRTARLHRLLKLDAPREVIKAECILVIRSLTGGTRLSTIRYLIYELIYHVWHFCIVLEIEVLLCRLNIFHSYQEMLVDIEGDSDESEMRCAFCDKLKEITDDYR